MKKDTEILAKLFSSKWNYAWGRVDCHVISLFYKHGGFEKLHEYIVSEKERMDKSKNTYFGAYYSEDLIETLQKAKDNLTEADFRDYIMSSFNVRFNKENFIQLEKENLLQHFYDFSDDFRGNIVCVHKIADYMTIETSSKKEGAKFYNRGNYSTVFSSLEEALIYQMYSGRYFDTLSTLLKSSKSEN